MVKEEEVNKALKQIVNFTKKMGNSIQGEAQGKTGDGQPIEGYNIQHGGHTVNVVTVPGSEYFSIIYPFNIPQNIALQRKASNKSQSELQSRNINIDKKDIQKATNDFKEYISEFDFKNIRMEFARTVSMVSSKAALEIETEGNIIKGFQIKTKLFPYRDGFNIAEFEEKIQETVTTGWTAREFLQDKYKLDEFIEGDISHQPTTRDTDMYQ